MILDLTPFQGLIHERCGLLFTDNNKQQQLANALAQRIAALAIGPSCYKAQLNKDEQEFQTLINLLTNNETYFFRESQQISLLVDRLVPRMLANRDINEPVRIMSAGCSSGEEPYSLAMALFDVYGPRADQLFTVIGADIDTTVLDRARKACYSEFSFRGVDPELRARYFDREGNHHVVKNQVKRMVSFTQLNLLANPTPTAPHNLDIVFFRNVSIYFDATACLAIHKNLAALMRDEAVLITGMTETMANDLGVFRPTEEDGLYYFTKGHLAPSERRYRPREEAPAVKLRKPDQPVRAPAAKTTPASCNCGPTASVPTPRTAAPVARRSPPKSQPQTLEQRLVAARKAVQERRFNGASAVLDAVLAALPDNEEALLLKAYLLLDRREFAAATALAERVLARDEWSVDALYLLGLSARWQQQAELAISWLKRAVYTCHECWPAHWYLGGLYRDKVALAPAKRAYGVVVHLLSATPVAETGLRHVPVELPPGEIIKLCGRQLAGLREAAQQAGEQ